MSTYSRFFGSLPSFLFQVCMYSAGEKKFLMTCTQLGANTSARYVNILKERFKVCWLGNEVSSVLLPQPVIIIFNLKPNFLFK